MSTPLLAYMGDAIYEVYVRKHVIEQGCLPAKELHKKSIKYVKASGQAEALQKMQDTLSDDESLIVRRAKNHKVTSKAKNADFMTYRWATAFEALVGYLYLSQDIKRMEEIIFRAMEEVDE